MFPITITLHTSAQLNAVMAALNAAGDLQLPTLPSAAEAPGKSTSAATTAAPARTQRTAAAAAATDAPAKTGDASSPTAAPAAPAPQPSTAATEVPYTDLQKAVAKLHGLDKTAALPIAKSFGFDTFMPLKEAENAGKRAEVLAAVNAKINELTTQEA